MAQQPESPPFSPSCSEGYFFEVRSVNISDAGSTSDDEYEFGSLSNSLNGLVHNKASNAFVTAAYPPSENNISTAIDTVARAANRLMMDDKYQANTNAKLEAQAAATNSNMDTQNSHNVYPIDTLIELGKSSKISRRALRFSEEAPAECILTQDVMATNSRDDKRHRGLSVTSQGTNASLGEDEQVMFKSGGILLDPDPMVYPSRQPRKPPPGFATGKVEAFYRRPKFLEFLIKHVSPTHSRVNSAGRIVPAGPNSPPPTFRVDLIDQVLRNADEATLGPETPTERTMVWREAVDVTKVEAAKTEVDDTKTGVVEGDVTDKAKNSVNALTEHFPAGSGIGAASVAPISDQISAQPTVNGASGPLFIPPGGEVLGVYADGRMIIFLDGGMYQSSARAGFPSLESCHNSIQPVQAPMIQSSVAIQPMMPLQQMNHFQPVAPFQQFPTLQQTLPQAMGGMYYSPMSNHAYGTDVFQGVQEPLPIMHLRHPVDGPVAFQSQMATQSQIQDLSAQHMRVGDELKHVEKHIALNEHLLSPMQLVQVTNRRKELVEKLDEIRKAKIHLERRSHMATQAIGHPELLASAAAYPAYNNQQTFTEKNAAFQSHLEPIGGRLGNNTIQVNSDNHELGVEAHMQHASFNGDTANGDSKRSFQNTSKNLSPNAPTFVPSAVASSVFNQTQARVRKPADRASSADSSVSAYPTLSPIPEVVVTEEEAAYCHDMGYNDPNQSFKMYCSRPVEFRDAINHVREHAKRYGCKGGQSKDPAWDAEQDIRWAMQNKEPIPMPPWTPDYVTNPRPWNWTDSFFNVRKDHDTSWSPPRYPQYSGKGKAPKVVSRDDKPHSPIPFMIDPSHRRKDSWDLPTTPWKPVITSESLNQGSPNGRVAKVDGSPNIESDDMVELRAERLIGPDVMKTWTAEYKARFLEVLKKIPGKIQSVAPVDKPAGYRQPYVESVTDEGSVSSGSRARDRGFTAETPGQNQTEWMDYSGGTSQRAGRQLRNGNGFQMSHSDAQPESPSPMPVKAPWPMPRRPVVNPAVAKYTGYNGSESHQHAATVRGPQTMPVHNQVNVAQYDSLQPVQGPWPESHHSEVRPKEVRVIPIESFHNHNKPHQFLRGILRPSNSGTQQPDVFSSDARNYQGNNAMAPVRGHRPLENMSNMMPATVNDQQRPMYKSRASMASPTFHAHGLPQVGDSKSAYVKQTLGAVASSHQAHHSRRPVTMNGGYANPSARIGTEYNSSSNMGRSFGPNVYAKPALPIQPHHNIQIFRNGQTHKGNIYDPYNTPDPEF